MGLLILFVLTLRLSVLAFKYLLDKGLWAVGPWPGRVGGLWDAGGECRAVSGINPALRAVWEISG